MSITKGPVLVNGKIPKNTCCPYKEECAFVTACQHTGESHSVAYSCASARAFDLISLHRHENERKQIAGNNS